MAAAKDKIMKGTTVECFLHFVAQHRDADVQLQAACQVKLLTARRWVARGGKLLPSGGTMNTLRVFLWDQGYEVAELAKIEPLYRELALLVGRGKVSADEVLKKIGFNADEIWRLFRGDRNLSAVRRGIAEEIIRQAQQAGARPEVPQAPPPTPVGVTETLLAIAASHVRALGPLLSQINGPACSDDDRAKFRELAGNGVVFEAANTLNQLCSTKARRMAGGGRGREGAGSE